MQINPEQIFINANDSACLVDSKYVNYHTEKGAEKEHRNKEVVVTGDSLLNGKDKKGLHKDKVTVNDSPACGTNYLIDRNNLLNTAKIMKSVKSSPSNTQIVFSSIIMRKD